VCASVLCALLYHVLNIILGEEAIGFYILVSSVLYDETRSSCAVSKKKLPNNCGSQMTWWFPI